MPKRTSGVVSQQSKVIVPTIADKITAQAQGLGIGFVPLPRVSHLIKEGKLVILNLSHNPKKKGEFKIAWISRPESRTLSWFLEALADPNNKYKILEFDDDLKN